jgi:hypothetical protein
MSDAFSPTLSLRNIKHWNEPLSMWGKGENNIEEDDFKPNKPIDLPSLNPQDAGPMYGTCYSNTGIEKEYETEDENAIGPDDSDDGFVPNKPIELESLNQQPTTFFGLEPKVRELDSDGNMPDAGLPVFTSTVILGMSIYFTYLGFFGEDVMIDPSMPIAF